jgi:hypothetical protein
MRPLGTLALSIWSIGAPSIVWGAATGCNTHQCDADISCIDGQGLMKMVSDAAACGPNGGGTPITGSSGPYNLQVSTNLSATGYELVWETTPIVGPWLDFPGQRTYVVQYPPGLSGHLPTSVEVYVSSDNPDNPDGGNASADATAAAASHANYTTASGSLAEFTNTTATQLSVLNATCAGYSMRMVVRAQVTAFDAGPDAP